MAGIAEVGAKKVKQPEVQGKDITIYFGVFFDGTNNHRLQVLLGKTYRSEKKHSEEIKEIDNKLEGSDSTQSLEKQRESYYEDELTEDEAAIAKDFTLDIDTKEDYELEKEYAEESVKVSIGDYESKKIDKYDDLLNRVKEKKYENPDDVRTNGFTNVALLEPFYQAKDRIEENEYAYRIYVSGSGTDRDIIDPDNETLKGAGFGQGDTGVIQKVQDAMCAIRLKLTLFNQANNINLKFHVFGFSRGATAARNFVYNLSKANDKKNLLKVLNNDKVKEYKVPFLGIYDTVASVGVLEKLDSKQIRDTAINFGVGVLDSGIMIGTEVLDSGLDAFHEVKGWLLKAFKYKSDSGWEYKINDHSATHQYNVKDLGLYATTESYQVGKVLHICAADEYRENFALVDIKSSIGSNGVEIFIPGAHSDVGGGYTDADVEVKLETVPYYNISSVNKSLKLQGKFLYNSSKEKNESTAVDSLRELGWIDDGRKTDYNHKHKRNIVESDYRLVRFYSGAIIGYNYISLHLMEGYANKHGGNVIFKKIEPRFRVPMDLENYKERIKKVLLIKEKGTIDIRATQPVDSDGIDYPKLRNKYLHFSSNYTRTKKIVHVNTPSLSDKGDAYEYERIVYQGVSSDDNPKKKQNIEDSKLVSQYMNDMTEKNLLSGATNIKERLIVLFNILQDYISKQNAKAKSTLQKNLSSHKGNCTEEGYYRGKLKIRIDSKGDINKTTKSFPDPYFEIGTMEIVIIPRGTIIDRYSGESGEFFGVLEFPKETRGIQPDLKEYKEHHVYKTREPLIAIKSKVAPEGFGKLGGADQYELFFNVPGGNKIHKNCARDLVAKGYIEQINDKDNPVNERE